MFIPFFFVFAQICQEQRQCSFNFSARYRYILMFYIIEMTAASLFGKFFIITRYLFRQYVQNATFGTRPLQQDLK